MQKLPPRSASQQPNQWLAIHSHIKTHSSYKPIYSQTNSYLTKLTSLLTLTQSLTQSQPQPQPHSTHSLSHPTSLSPPHQILLPHKSQHLSLLSTLKLTYSKLIDQIYMLDLTQLATCVEFVLEKLMEGLQGLYGGLGQLVGRFQEEGRRRDGGSGGNFCGDCKGNIMRNNISNIMTTMTLTEKPQFSTTFSDKKTRQLELSALDSPYPPYSSSSSPSSPFSSPFSSQFSPQTDLSQMIDQILLKKQSILSTPTTKTNNIYEQIVQYLQNIPQNTINLSKENNVNVNVVVGSIQDVGGIGIDGVVGSFGSFFGEFQRNFGEMLRNPIMGLIKRVLNYAKVHYYRPRSYETVSTQTLLIKDQQNIKMLLKNAQNLQKQLQLAKKSKREAQQDMLRMLQTQQINLLKISQTTQQLLYQKQKLQRTSLQLNETKIKLTQLQHSKKQKEQKIIKDHHHQRTLFIKSIKQLEIKIQVTSSQLARLRKETQGMMVSEMVMTDGWESFGREVQTDDRGEFQVNRNSMGNQSKKNYVSKFANINRRSVNNNSNSNTNSNTSNLLQTNQPDTINESLTPTPTTQSPNPTQTPNLNPPKTPTKPSPNLISNLNLNQNPPPISPYPSPHLHPSNSHSNKKPRESEQNLYQPDQKYHYQYQEEFYMNVLDGRKMKKNLRKRESIVQQIQMMKLEKNKRVSKKSEYRNIDPTLTPDAYPFQPQPQPQQYNPNRSHTRSEFNLKFDTYPYPRPLPLHPHPNHPSQILQPQSRPKLSSSRMFIPKQHCHPYISTNNNSGSFSCGQDAWLDLIQVNSVRRERERERERDREMEEREDREKMQLVSKFMQKYGVLKEKGLLGRIQEIFEVGEFEEMGDSNCDSHVQLKPNQPDLNPPNPQPTQTQTPQKLPKPPNLHYHLPKKSTKPIKQTKQNKPQLQPQLQPQCPTEKISKKQSIVFGKNQVVLLFGSIQYARKYQLSVEIWGSLENSIMLDYNFMSLCDGVEVFLGGLLKNQPNLYNQLALFLLYPISYPKHTPNLIPNFSKTLTSNPTHTHSHSLHPLHPNPHLNPNLHPNPNPNLSTTIRSNFTPQPYPQSLNPQIPTPHEIRNIFHNILRFHKIVHKKCRHVQEFLGIVGYQEYLRGGGGADGK